MVNRATSSSSNALTAHSLQENESKGHEKNLHSNAFSKNSSLIGRISDYISPLLETTIAAISVIVVCLLLGKGAAIALGAGLALIKTYSYFFSPSFQCSTQTFGSSLLPITLIKSLNIRVNPDATELSAFFRTCSLKKARVYQKFIKNGLDDSIEFSKYSVQKNILKNSILTLSQGTLITKKKGVFEYPQDNESTVHFTANFADSNLFGFYNKDLCAQDELQTMELPSLPFVKKALQSNGGNLDRLNEGSFEVALITGAKRRGRVGGSLYGNNFNAANTGKIDQNTTLLEPRSANIFCMAAPHIGFAKGKPYHKEDLEKLFYRSYGAFSAIKSKSTKKAAVHTGNFGCGAFGNSPKVAAILQIAAARLANVDELYYYPMNREAEYDEALAFLDNHFEHFSNMTIDQFLEDLTNHAREYGLFYEEGNGT